MTTLFSSASTVLAAAGFAVLAALSGTAIGAAPAEAAEAGTASPAEAARANVSANVALGAVRAHVSYTAASVGTGGAGLRNRGAAGVDVSGMQGNARAAFVYWSVIVSGNQAGVDQVDVQRTFPLPASTSRRLTGTLVGSGPSPCWGGSEIRVYRADVPLDVASGNGQYRVAPIPGAAGRTDGSSPWSGTVYPLWEGASLAVIGTGSATVALYDRRLSGATFGDNLSYVLRLPQSTAWASDVKLIAIGADGQRSSGSGLVDHPSLTKEFVRVNGHRASGPGAPGYDGGWNGAAGGPVAQLWDHTMHDVTAAARAAAVPTDMRVAHFTNAASTYDCLTPVANIVTIR